VSSSAHLIHFSWAVQKVALLLLNKGLIPLPEIIRGTELPPPQVRQALLVLVQHNCVGAYQRGEENTRNPKTPVFVYDALPDRILQNIRYPILERESEALQLSY
jgi:DNA-directed RNA polymerase III subunit RPC3